MTSYSQADRPLAVTTPLGLDELLLTGFRGRTAISELFRFELDMLSTKSVSFDGLLGQSVQVRLRSLEGQGEQFFHGIISRLRVVSRSDDFVQYQADMVPQLWLLTQTLQSRSFQPSSLGGQELTVPNILKKLFQGRIDAFRFDLREPHPARNQCIQYNESDFAFSSRLMEEEGMYIASSICRTSMCCCHRQCVGVPDLPGMAKLNRVSRSAMNIECMSGRRNRPFAPALHALGSVVSTSGLEFPASEGLTRTTGRSRPWRRGETSRRR